MTHSCRSAAADPADTAALRCGAWSATVSTGPVAACEQGRDGGVPATPSCRSAAADPADTAALRRVCREAPTEARLGGQKSPLRYRVTKLGGKIYGLGRMGIVQRTCHKPFRKLATFATSDHKGHERKGEMSKTSGFCPHLCALCDLLWPFSRLPCLCAGPRWFEIS